jgi:hypothetical protein
MIKCTVRLGEGMGVWGVGFDQQAQRQGCGAARQQDHERDHESLELAPTDVGARGGDDGVHRTASRAGSDRSIAPSISVTSLSA